MADLQAATAAANLLDDVKCRPCRATFKVELICTIDAIDHGTLVWRTPQRHVLLPSMRLLHSVKRSFERNDLRQYR